MDSIGVSRGGTCNVVSGFCRPFCQHEGPVSRVFHSFQESRQISKMLETGRKKITYGT
jgi:hypothetical protein